MNSTLGHRAPHFLVGLRSYSRNCGLIVFQALSLGVGLGVRLDEGADVGGELGVFDLGAGRGAGGEVLDAADAGSGLVLAGGDGVAVEAEASFGRAGTAVAHSVGDLGLEEAALVALEAARRRADQLLIHVSCCGHGFTLRASARCSTATSILDKSPLSGFSLAGRLKGVQLSSSFPKWLLFQRFRNSCS